MGRCTRTSLLLLVAVIGIGLASCVERQPQAEITRSRVTFQMALSPEENETFKRNLAHYLAREVSLAGGDAIQAIEIQGGSYAVLAVKDCRHRERIIRGLVRESAPKDQLEKYFAIATAKSTCVDGLPVPHVACDVTQALGGKGLVATEQAARGVFLALERSFKPDADRSTYPDVMTADYGDHWWVGRGRMPRRFLFWRESPRYGGGQLGLHISKCDGRVRRVELQE